MSTSSWVHVWLQRVDVGAPSDELYGLLDREERARAERFRFERDRARFIARRAFRRQVLADYVRAAPNRIRYRISRHGRPRLEPACGIAFSTSHSDGCAVVAVGSDALLGVDIERVRPIPDALSVAEQSFTRREVGHLAVAAGSTRSEVFLRLWTRKESYAKAIGLGLDLSLDAVDVLGPNDHRTCRTVIDAAGRTVEFTTLEMPAGYVGTVATAGSPVVFQRRGTWDGQP